MSQPLVLAIDQGSTNTKALLVGESGEIVAQASRRTATRYPRPGWVEQSARDIWSSVRMAICDVVAPDQDIRAIAISNQREICRRLGREDRRTGRTVHYMAVPSDRRTM